MRPCILTGAAGEDPDDCTTHGHEKVGPGHPVYSEAYQNGESSHAADWSFALSEVAGLPDEIARLGPIAFATWLRGHIEAADGSRE